MSIGYILQFLADGNVCHIFIHQVLLLVCQHFYFKHVMHTYIPPAQITSLPPFCLSLLPLFSAIKFTKSLPFLFCNVPNPLLIIINTLIDL